MSIKVKALEWTQYPDGGLQAIGAKMERFRVRQNGRSWYLGQDYMGEGGKDAAQAWFNAAILSVLKPSPDMREAVDWQRFDTAPTDGTVILAYRDDAGVFTAHFVEDDAHIATPNNPPQGDAYWFTTSGEDLTNDMPTLWAHVPQPSVAALRSLTGAKPEPQPAAQIAAETSPGPINCSLRRRFHGLAYPRTCSRCGLGPCPFFNDDGTPKP